MPLPEDHTPDGETSDTWGTMGDISATSIMVSTGSAASDGEPVDTSPAGGDILATSFTADTPVLVEDSPPTRLLGTRLQAGGDFSADSFRSLARSPAEERVRGPVGLLGEVNESSVNARRVSLQLSPIEQRERFKQFTDARTKLFSERWIKKDESALVPAPRNLWGEGSPGGVVDDWGGGVDDGGPSYSYNWDFRGVPRRLVGPQGGSAADVSSLEDSWAPVPPHHDSTADIDSWDPDLVLLATVPDRSDIGETARHTSRLLEAFSHGATPPVPGAFTTTQQRLLSAALMSILAIMPDRCVDAAAQSDPPPSSVNTATTTDPLPSMVDTAAETDPLPPSVDLTMRPDATCVVCFTRIANTVLAPCWHLVLCAVCICFQDIIIS